MNVADLRELFAYDEWANRRAFGAATGLTEGQLGTSWTVAAAEVLDRCDTRLRPGRRLVANALG
jgi:hypothetical protein